jgi:hypothetical protein
MFSHSRVQLPAVSQNIVWCYYYSHGETCDTVGTHSRTITSPCVPAPIPWCGITKTALWCSITKTASITNTLKICTYHKIKVPLTTTSLFIAKEMEETKASDDPHCYCGQQPCTPESPCNFQQSQVTELHKDHTAAPSDE